MDQTPNLTLPYLAAAQSQKHVTHNEAIRALDALVQLAILDRDLVAPPQAPSAGDRYVVGAGAAGDWAGQDGAIAAWQDGAWEFYMPREGWLAWVADEDALLVWSGSQWIGADSGSGTNPAPLVGVNTTADTTNRLSTKSNAVLFSHDDVTPGSGDMRQVLNKAAVGNTVSQLYQTNFSGRAETGLTGDDDFHFKVSPDGSTWFEGLVIDKDTGAVTFPNTAIDVNQNLLINGDFQLNLRAFAGGALAANVYGRDRWKASAGGANWSVSGFVVTLASGGLEQIVESALWGVANFASTQVTVSVDTPSADLTVSFGSASGVIAAGSGQRSVTLTTGSGDTGNLALKISASGSASFGRVKLELGAKATGWQPRPVELVLAARYYQIARCVVGNNTLGGTTYGYLSFPRMRAAPTVVRSAAYVTGAESGTSMSSIRDNTVGLFNTTGVAGGIFTLDAEFY